MYGMVNWIKENTAWLYTKIYESPVFFFDYWSMVHLYSGISLFILLTSLKIRNRWTWLSIILFSYEVMEITLGYVALNIFEPETIKDQFTDIGVGYLGGFIGQYLLKEKNIFHSVFNKKIDYRHIVAVHAALTIAFLWVGNYGYQYNQPLLNSPGLNWYAFLLWFIGLVTYLTVYSFYFKNILKNTFLLILFSWLCAFTVILIIEYVGYYILFIHMVSHNVSYNINSALILGVIHGTKYLHIFYVSAPLIGIAVFEVFNIIFFAAKRNEILIQRDFK